MKYYFFLLALALSTSCFGQYQLRSIDINTAGSGNQSFTYHHAGYNSPFGLGVTLQKDSAKYQLYGRLSAYAHGGLIYNTYQDTANEHFTHNDKIIYRLPLGDSILTHGRSLYTQGYGFQIGVRRDFQLWTVPIYTAAHIGLYGHHYDSRLRISHTINTPDTVSLHSSYFGNDYIQGSTMDTYEEEGWSFVPQLGVETGIVLSAGERLQFIPKIVFNMAHVTTSVIQSEFSSPLKATVSRQSNLNINSRATLQISYLLNRN